MSNFKKDYYKILDLSQFANLEEAKSAYRKQVKKYHPDLHPGELKFEELIKEINEAYEILGDKDEKFAYDEYLQNKKAAGKKQQNRSNNQRSYTKKVAVETEHFVYIKGIIIVKYKGLSDNSGDSDNLKETFYKIIPTKLDADILEQNMFHDHHHIPDEIVKALNNKNACKFKTPKLVNCAITSSSGVKYYQLEILDLTILDIKIEKVTKYESESFGVIHGTFYGFTKKVIIEEKEISVTECYGETGRTEDKYENGIRYLRKQYFNTDCTTYWGNWVADIPKPTTVKTGNSQRKGDYIRYEYFNSISKAKFWDAWEYQRNYQKSVGIGCLSFIFNTLIVCFYLMLLFSIIGSVFNKHQSSGQKKLQKPRLVVTENKIPNRSKNDNKQERLKRDTFLLHSLQWEDYDGNQYEGSFGVRKSVYIKSHWFKENLSIQTTDRQAYDEVVYNLKEYDKNNLGSLYSLFDSLKVSNQLNENRFAEMVVSFIQSIPYTLILSKSCDASLYDDDFTNKYLRSEDAKCLGNQKFGINTPVEFLGYLEGDCDTRTLILYTVLAHYNYDVVLLSSEQYGHSIIGVNLPYDGKAYSYNNQRYVFWETTAPNIKPGYLPKEISNTNYWRISLKSN